jgi:hypothetical protein
VDYEPQDDDVLDRARRIFGVYQGSIHWPYGLEPAPWHRRRGDPAWFAWRCREKNARQRVIVDWAERYGLKASTADRCPLWLLRTTSRACRFDQCLNDGVTHPWLDHVIPWLKDGKPAVVTSAPYEFAHKGANPLAAWMRDRPTLACVTGTGWYGYTTTQVVIWLPDRIESMEAAPGIPTDARFRLPQRRSAPSTASSETASQAAVGDCQ